MHTALMRSYRSVRLDEVRGRLLLGEMPGRHEPFETWLGAVTEAGVTDVVSLTGDDEIAEKSPEFLVALSTEDSRIPQRTVFPIADFGVPEDRGGYAETVDSMAAKLRVGGVVFVHCGAGVGRTGTFAVCVLCAIGLSDADALKRVRVAGGEPETKGQTELVAWFSGREDSDSSA